MEINQKWIKVKVLGKGSYGLVFLARSSTMAGGHFRHVALKVASLNHSSSLKKEKHILRNFIGCPEIVQCFGSEVTVEDHGHVYYNLVLEYAPGGTLADLVTRRGKLPESEAKGYLRMILRGLCHVHGKGFVHGDLKPANILVFREYDDGYKLKLKIADFGISGRCEELNEETLAPCDVVPKFRGTPRYMSPESVFYGTMNAALDVWSLGCILIEMVSGKRVWSNCKNDQEIMRMIAYYMEYPDIPEELSSEGRDFLMRCFNQNYKERWTVEMLLQHSYVIEEEQRSVLDNVSLINRFHGSCFEQNYHLENRRSNNFAVGN